MKKIKRFRFTAFKRVCHSLQVPRLNPLNMLSRKIFLKSFIEKSDQYKELVLPGFTSAQCVRESCTHWIFGRVTRWGLFAPMRFPFPTCFHREKCFHLSWAMRPPFSNQANTGLQGWSKRNEKSRLGHLSKRPDSTAIFNNSYHSIHSGLLKTLDIFKRGFSSNRVCILSGLSVLHTIFVLPTKPFSFNPTYALWLATRMDFTGISAICY